MVSMNVTPDSSVKTLSNSSSKVSSPGSRYSTPDEERGSLSPRQEDDGGMNCSTEGDVSTTDSRQEDGDAATKQEGDGDILQSDLPLLFANGAPTSLESMSLKQLQHFLLFIFKCENGVDISELEDIDRPDWWPEDTLFENELLKHETKKGHWSIKLRGIIKSAYRHHGASFLLEFSRRLMVCTQRLGKINTVDNGDGTRSMRTASTSKLLVTFRAENQDYDKCLYPKPNFNTQSPLKGVSRSMLVSTNNSSDPRLPKWADVFLCEYCGKGFNSQRKVEHHERTICKVQPNRDDPVAVPGVVPLPAPAEAAGAAEAADAVGAVAAEAEAGAAEVGAVAGAAVAAGPIAAEAAEAVGAVAGAVAAVAPVPVPVAPVPVLYHPGVTSSINNRYFDYLGLMKAPPPKDDDDNDDDGNNTTQDSSDQPQQQPSSSSSSSSSGSIVRPKPSSYTKFLSIDFASPLGQYILKLDDGEGVSIPVNIDAICSGSDRRGMRSAGANGFPVTYRGPKNRTDLKQAQHVYCFTDDDRQERKLTLQRGLTRSSFMLYLSVNSKKNPRLAVKLRRLLFKNGQIPKSGTVKLVFDYKKAELLLIKRPRHIHPQAKLIPLAERLKLPPQTLSMRVHPFIESGFGGGSRYGSRYSSYHSSYTHSSANSVNGGGGGSGRSTPAQMSRRFSPSSRIVQEAARELRHFDIMDEEQFADERKKKRLDSGGGGVVQVNGGNNGSYYNNWGDSLGRRQQQHAEQDVQCIDLCDSSEEENFGGGARAPRRGGSSMAVSRATTPTGPVVIPKLSSFSTASPSSILS